MGLVEKLEIKVATIAAQDLTQKAKKGSFGAFVQRAYLATEGKKTAIGSLLLIITLAVGQFNPPWADCYVRYAAIFSGVLTAIGLLDKARRNEPVFEPWFLEALASVSAWISSMSTTVLAFSAGGGLDLMFPGHPGLSDQVTIWTTAITTATAFLNRLAKASAENPKGA